MLSGLICEIFLNVTATKGDLEKKTHQKFDSSRPIILKWN